MFSERRDPVRRQVILLMVRTRERWTIKDGKPEPIRKPAGRSASPSVHGDTSSSGSCR